MRTGKVTESVLWAALVAVLAAGIVLMLRRPSGEPEGGPVDCGSLKRESGLGFIGLLVSVSDVSEATNALRLGTALKPDDVHRSSATCVFEMDSGAVFTARAATVAFLSAKEARCWRRES